MFHWICPECGREIPPRLKECPSCDPQASAVPLESSEASSASVAVASGVASASGAAVAPEPIAPLPEPVPIEKPVPIESAAIVDTPLPEPAPIETAAIVDAPLPKPALVENTACEPEPVPSFDPMLVLAEQVREAQNIERIEVKPAAVEKSIEETPVKEPSPPVRPAEPQALLTAATPLALLAAPQPVASVTADPMPATADRTPEPVFELTSPEPPPLDIAPLPHEIPTLELPIVEVQRPATESEPQQLELSSVELSQCDLPALKPVESVSTSAAEGAGCVSTGPADPKPTAPIIPEVPGSEDVGAEKVPSGSWLQLAPLQDYTSAAGRAMHPVAPVLKILTPDSGPRMTLPGPTLPPELATFRDANILIARDAPHSRKFGMPGWLVSFLVMLMLLLAGMSISFYFLPVAHSNAETKPVVEPPHATASPAPVSHSLSEFIEVTGFRILVDFNKKSEIHYLVVNHTGAAVSDVTVYVTLRAADAKSGQPPLCRFSFRAPSLGPFESKEMSSSIEKLNRTVTLPDWQDLRSEVQIAQ